jgi:L-iditol 2-dehydrogenase
MKALVYYGPEDIRLSEIANPKPAPGEALIQVKACGVCGSDVHGYLGITGRRIPPMVMGHEFSGQVAEVGAGVAGIEAGDRVAPYPVIFCGDCAPCRRGDVHLCLNKKALGVLSCNGAMAEYVSVPSKLLFKLDDSVSYELGSMMEPLAVSYRGVNRAGDVAGKNVLVVGSGTIGLLATAILRTRHPERIFVSDTNDARLDVAKRMGADVVINPRRDNLADIIRRATNGAGADVALEAVGATPTVEQAMAGLRMGGTAVWIGNSAKMIELDMQQIVTRELRVVGSFLYSFQEFQEVAEMLNQGKLTLEPMISLRAPMTEKGVELFAKLAKNPGSLIKVILTN